jgi:hypothetical protein
MQQCTNGPTVVSAEHTCGEIIVIPLCSILGFETDIHGLVKGEDGRHYGRLRALWYRSSKPVLTTPVCLGGALV